MQDLSILPKERPRKPVGSYQASANTLSYSVDWVSFQLIAVAGDLLRGSPSQDRTVNGPGVWLRLCFFEGGNERIKRHCEPQKLIGFREPLQQ